MLDGHGNPPLSELGLWQADRVGQRLSNEKISAIYTSNLVRTQQTAAPLARTLGIQPKPVFALREIFLGSGEGGVFRKWIAEEHPVAVEMYNKGDWGVIPGAESAAQLTTRCAPALSEIAANHVSELVAVFVHGGVIGALIGNALGTSAFAHAGSRHTALTHLVITPERWIVRSFNDASHMGTITSDTQL
jgi:probable phosphoglycerate mutase